MTPEARLRALLAAATVRPWAANGNHVRAVDEFSGEPRAGLRVGLFPYVASVGREDDAALIAAAVNALPVLLAVVEAARVFAATTDYGAGMVALRDLEAALSALETAVAK